MLDAFTFTETTGFVDKLFECLTTKNYLGNPPVKEESKIPLLKVEEKEEVIQNVFLLTIRKALTGKL